MFRFWSTKHYAFFLLDGKNRSYPSNKLLPFAELTPLPVFIPTTSPLTDFSRSYDDKAGFNTYVTKGRFLTRDTYEFSPFDPVEHDRYTY